MAQTTFVTRVLAWKPQRVNAQCAYNVSAIDSADSCDQALGLNTTSPFSLLTGSTLPPNHVCSNESSCLAFYGAATTTCCISDGSCRQCAVSGSRAAARCVICVDNPCFDPNNTGPTRPWTGVDSTAAPLFPTADLSGPTSIPATHCPLTSCRRTSEPILNLEPVASEPDRANTSLLTPLNTNLTVGVAYGIQPPDTWTPYLSQGCGAESNLRLSVTVSGPPVVPPFRPSDEVLMNAEYVQFAFVYLGCCFTLADTPPPRVLCRTGFMFVRLSRAYSATVTIVVSSDAGAVVTNVNVASWTFSGYDPDVTEVSVASHPTTAHPEYGPGQRDCENGQRVDGVRYDRHFTCDCAGTAFVGPRCELSSRPRLSLETNYGQIIPVNDSASDYEFYNRTKWAFGKTYSIAPFNLSRAYTTRPGVGRVYVPATSLSYGLTFFGVVQEIRGFFVDGNNGEMLVKIPRTRLNLSAFLLVDAPNALPATAANLTFQILPADVDNAQAQGPGGMGCQNGGTKTDVEDGESEFDLQYACSCRSGYSGANCEIDVAAAASGGNSGSAWAFAAIGVIVGVLFVVLVVSRYLVYRAQNKPEDMLAMQAEILSSLGMGGVSMNVAPDEVRTFVWPRCVCRNSQCIILYALMIDGISTQLQRIGWSNCRASIAQP